MNKKLIVGGIAILSMTAIIVGQTNAASSTLKNEIKNNKKIEHMNKGMHMGSGEHMGSGLHLGSGFHTGLKLGSGNKIRSEEKEHIGSGNRSKFESGDNKHFGSGFMFGSGNKMGSDEREHFGSGNKLGTGMNKKVEKLGSVFKKMSDEKLNALLTQINTRATSITDPTLLNSINSLKALIQQNIGN